MAVKFENSYRARSASNLCSLLAAKSNLKKGKDCKYIGKKQGDSPTKISS